MTTTLDTRSHPPTRLALHASRIVIDVGVLLVLGAMTLPFVSTEGFGQRAVAADALPAFLLLLPIFVLTLLPDQTRPVPTVLGWASLLLALTAAPYAVVKALDASSLAHTLGGRVGSGAWLLVAGAFLTVAGIIYGLVRNLLHLPVAGTYPARPQPAAPTPAAGRGAPATARARPVAPATGDAPPAPATRPGGGKATRQPAPTVTPRPPGLPPGGTPAPQRPVAPRPTDPDTEPTLPSVKPVRHWWPDDLEDLFD